MPFHVLLFGPPGSGKSTQGALLSKKRGVPHISIGALLRTEADSGSALSRMIAPELGRGEMVPNGAVMALLREHLRKLESGFILDGFPRTKDQLPLLENLAAELGLHGYRAVDFDIPRAESHERLMARGRGDDKPDVIHRRLDAYQELSEPVLAYFDQRQELVVVDGTGTVDEVAARLDEALKILA